MMTDNINKKKKSTLIEQSRRLQNLFRHHYDNGLIDVSYDYVQVENEWFCIISTDEQVTSELCNNTIILSCTVGGVTFSTVKRV